MTALNLKQLRFCQEYAKDCNATQAAIRAGYSRKTAAQIAEKLLRKAEIRSEIAKIAAPLAKKAELTAEMVLQELAYILNADPGDLLDEGGHLKDMRDLTPGQRRCIASVQFGSNSKDRKERIVKIRYWDKLRAAELAAKYLGLIKENRWGADGGVEVTAPVTLNIAFVKSDGNGRPLRESDTGTIEV